MTTEKKKVILTLCKVFPVTHSQAGKPTEFGKHLQEGVKIHTVRGNNKNLWDQRADQIKSGKKYLSVREWSGRPYNSEQVELAQFQKGGLQHITITNIVSDPEPQCWVDESWFLSMRSLRMMAYRWMISRSGSLQTPTYLRA